MRYLLSIALLCSIIFFSFIPTQPAEIEEPLAVVEAEEKEVVFSEDPQLKMLVDGLADVYGLNPDQYAVAVVNYKTGQSYYYNEKVPFTAASLYKLPLAMLYYEDLNNKVLPANQAYTYLPEHYEGPGDLSGELIYNDLFLSDLLHYMIQHSDNNSAHILYENRGGWPGYVAQRSRYARYGDQQMRDLQQQMDLSEMENRQNQITAAYMSSCLGYLVEHRQDFPVLLQDMAIAEPTNFLNGKLTGYYNQKYGNIGAFLNIAGVSLQDSPYSVVVLTVGENLAEHYMTDLGVLLRDYFNPDQAGQNLSEFVPFGMEQDPEVEYVLADDEILPQLEAVDADEEYLPETFYQSIIQPE